MGLLKAGIGALSGVLADQWREYFYCDSLAANVLVTKGKKRISGRSSNKKGEDNIISNGSIIAVNEGQCMLIADQGKVVELCAEAGEFVYDSSTEPSIFYGSLGENIVATFKNIGQRFTFGGNAGKDQRIYFFNTKEIIGNKYGTPNAVPFRVVDNNIGLDIDISIRCHGEYSYKITDPLLFYTNVCGNVEADYVRETIDSQLKTELMTALQPAFAKISGMGIRYSALPGHTMEMSDALNEVLSQKWSQLRGISIASFGVSSVKASEEDEAMIKTLQKSAVMRDPSMAAATLVGAQSDAMRSAAENKGGAMTGFMGLGMAQNAGGMNAQDLFAMGAKKQENTPQPQPAQTIENTWKCECGHENTGNGRFCAECGKPKSTDWKCECGNVNKGKFCAECGKPKPAKAKTYKCDKCGWEPEDKTTPPKFCPECGDKFDNDDEE
jgi:Putative virion core protein (lumpy skin disease virus)